MGAAKYGKPEELEKLIDEYFARFENREPLRDKNGDIIFDKWGKPVFDESLPTSSGLAYFLGFENRCSLWEYAQKPTFARVIHRANLRLQQFWEPVLASKNSSGAIFWLSNIKDDWKDMKSIETTAVKAPKTALVVYVNAQTTKLKPANIPTIEAETVQSSADPAPIAKPKRIASHGKKLGRPKKRGRKKGTKLKKSEE